MIQQATVLFENNPLITNNEAIKQFVKNSSSKVNPLPFEHDGKLVVVVKMRESEKKSYDSIRMIAGSIARELKKRKVESAFVRENDLANAFSDFKKGAVITAFVEGWHLGSYQFLKYKSKKEQFETTLQLDGDENTASYAKVGEIRAEATAFARDLTNEIPSTLNPETFPAMLKDAFKDTPVKVTVFDQEELEKRQMNGLLTVGRGSTHSPAFVELEYRKDDSKPLVALVGKGVTFDTGGISLKRGKDLSSMRMDMGGAAAVSGAMKLLADSDADVNVVALIPIAENMPDNTSLIPGDVIKYKNGLTVQAGNTDAEGRLILADALIRAGELNSDYIIDIATLTGAIVSALGTKIAGVFGDEELTQKMKEIGRNNGDFVWPMPLIDEYDNYLKSDYADFNNTSSKAVAGSITAGLFLRRFVPKNTKWLHVDMAGVMDSEEKGYYTKSARGFGARLLADFTEHISK